MTLAQKLLRARIPVYSPARWLKCLDRKADSPGSLFPFFQFRRRRTKTVKSRNENGKNISLTFQSANEQLLLYT